MLILTRKLDQSIQIGPDITIQVLKIMGDRVSIGVSAPKDLRISRTDAPGEVALPKP